MRLVLANAIGMRKCAHQIITLSIKAGGRWTLHIASKFFFNFPLNFSQGPFLFLKHIRKFIVGPRSCFNSPNKLQCCVSKCEAIGCRPIGVRWRKGGGGTWYHFPALSFCVLDRAESPRNSPQSALTIEKIALKWQLFFLVFKSSSSGTPVNSVMLQNRLSSE